VFTAMVEAFSSHHTTLRTYHHRYHRLNLQTVAYNTTRKHSLLVLAWTYFPRHARSRTALQLVAISCFAMN